MRNVYAMLTVLMMMSSMVRGNCQTPSLPAPHEVDESLYGGGIGATMTPYYQSVCAGQSAEITITLDGTAPWIINYTTNGTNNFQVVSLDDVYVLTVTPTQTTGYTITSVVDGLGCTAEGSNAAVVYWYPTPTLSLISTNVLCYAYPTGSATVTASNGTSPYSYTWSNGQHTATASNLIAGTYTVTVSDLHACSAMTTVSITQPSQLVAIATATNVSCGYSNNGYINLTVNGGLVPYSYQWNTGATTQHLQNVPAGTYAVTVTDANGCTNVATAVVGIDPPLNVSVTSTNVACFGGFTGTATATATGGTNTYAYHWSNNQAAQTATGLSAGSYSVTVTDGNGCSGMASTTITQPTELQIAYQATHISCDGATLGTASVSVVGGVQPYTYTWSNGQTGTSVANLTAGTYACTVTDTNGCIDMVAFTIVQPTTPIADAGNNVSSCEDAEVILTATGGEEYVWSTGETTAEITVVPGTTTTYTVTVTNDYGCTASDAVTVTVTPIPNVTFDLPGNVCAQDGPIELAPLVDVPGIANPGGWFYGSGVMTGSFFPTVVGVGTWEITYYYQDNTTGCEVQVVEQITVRPLPTVQFALPQELQHVCLTSEPVVLAGGEPSDATNFWYQGTGVSNNIFDPAAAGVGQHIIDFYAESVYGCMGVASQSIWVDAPVTVSVTAPADEFCSNDDAFNLTLSPSGGYVMLDGVTHGTEIIPTVGTHTVIYTVPTSGQCGGSDTLTYTVYQSPVASILIADSVSITVPFVNIVAAPTGGILTVDGFQSGIVFYPSQWGVGTHTIAYTVIGAGDCVDVAVATVIVYQPTSVEPIWAESISLYPNPVNDVLNITIGTLQQPVIQVVDMLGQVIVDFTSDDSEVAIPMDQLAPGVYYVKITSDNEHIVRKVLKQ